MKTKYIINSLIAGTFALMTFPATAETHYKGKRAPIIQLIEQVADEKEGIEQARKQADFTASERDSIERLDGGYSDQRHYVGAVNTVPLDFLKRFPDLTVTNGLQGQTAGLIARPNNGGVGYNSADLFVRGQHTNGNNTAIVIIDGVERPMDDILPEEIESITILKDAVSKIIYGPGAANGVISVATKRGRVGDRVIRASAESGAMISTRMPAYLNSYDYARFYNEARRNDGLPDLYMPHQLEGYRNSSGANDLLYPDVDYYSHFLRNESVYRKATVESFGGNDRIKYAVVVGYSGFSGLEKIGKRSDLNRFNIRGNLDIRISDYLVAKTDVAGRLEIRDWGRRDAANIFSAISSHRPNEYPFIIDPGAIDLPSNEDDVPYFGTNERFSDNLYADLEYGGTTSERYAANQANLGLDFDFNKFVPGLKAAAYVTFDNYNYLRQQLANTYPTYAIEPYFDADGDEQVRFTQMRRVNLPKDHSIADDQTLRTIGWRANIGYDRRVGLHDFSAFAAYRYYKYENKGTTQDVIDANYSLRLNYLFNQRYIVEADFAYMGSNKFAPGNKFFAAGALGAAWVVSNEPFMQATDLVNFLKLKASYGVLGYSGNTGYDLFRTSWSENGNMGFNEQNNTNVWITSLTRYGNPNLKWEQSQELNVGIEGLFFDNRLAGELNYFDETRSNIIGTNGALYGAYIGNYTMVENMGEVRNRGFDAAVSWRSNVSDDFRYSVGMNLTYSSNELIAWNEHSNIEDYRKSIGRPTSAIFGLQAQGLFGRDVNLVGHPFQSFGPYQNGDIAYADLNNDGVVDGRDATVIGRSFPSAAWGIHADFQYENWGLYLLGTAETGIDQTLTNSYYWNTGIGKYSTQVLDRYHESDNPTGSYPRLTSTIGDNSFRNSSFWVRSAAFFRLKNVELSYTFFNKNTTGFYKNIKIHTRGSNLLVLSGIKDLDPERLAAGVTNYPVYASLTGGLTVTF